jgi:hypothetical protein
MPASLNFLLIYQGDLAMVPLAQSLDYIGPIGDVVSGLLQMAATQEVAARRWKSHGPLCYERDKPDTRFQTDPLP